MKPRVSVVIPCYNGEKSIEHTIESILAQDFGGDLDVIVVDDASTDSTENILKTFGNRIRYIRLEVNSGSPCRPRNVGIRSSSGEFIALVDQDDIWNPDKLRKQLGMFDDPDVGLVFSDCGVICDKTIVMEKVSAQRSLKRGMVLHDILMNNFIITSTVVMRRSVLDRIGLFNENIFPAEDLDLWIRISAEFKVDYSPEVLVYYRRSDNQFSQNWKKMLEARFPVICEYANKYFESEAAREIIRHARHIDAMRHYWMGEYGTAKRKLFSLFLEKPRDVSCLKYILLSFVSRRMKMQLKRIGLSGG